MSDFRTFIKQHIPFISVCIFVFIFYFIYYYKPAFLFRKPENSIRLFGIGTKEKTILPIWIVSILLAIFCYLFVLYYVYFPKIIL